MKLINVISIATLIAATSFAVRSDSFAQSMASADPAPVGACEEWNQGSAPTSASATAFGTGSTLEFAEQNADAAARNALSEKIDAEIAGTTNCPGTETCDPGFSGCEADAKFDQRTNVVSSAIGWEEPDGSFKAIGRAAVTPGTKVKKGCGACLAIIEPIESQQTPN